MPDLRLGGAVPHGGIQPIALGGRHLLQPLELLRGQVRAQLRDDVQIDEPDRRRRDHEEQCG
jgi:hypothetical protein